MVNTITYRIKRKAKERIKATRWGSVSGTVVTMDSEDSFCYKGHLLGQQLGRANSDIKADYSRRRN